MRSENNPLINALEAFAVGDAVGYITSSTKQEFDRVDILKDSGTSEEWRSETKNKINALGIECNIVRFK